MQMQLDLWVFDEIVMEQFWHTLTCFLFEKYWKILFDFLMSDVLFTVREKGFYCTTSDLVMYLFLKGAISLVKVFAYNSKYKRLFLYLIILMFLLWLKFIHYSK